MSGRIDRRTVLRAAVAGAALTVVQACAGKPGAQGPRSRESSVPPVSRATPTTNVSISIPIPTTSTSTVPVTTGPATTASPPIAPTSTTTPNATGQPAVYANHGATTSDAVALTFHLGGDPVLVARLLDLMRDSQLRVTAFAIGSWITAHADLGHRVVDEGHEMGNHTERHLSMLDLSRDQVRAEITEGGQALVPFIGSIGRWFRPSGTDVPSQLILEEAGRAGYPVSVGYDVDSRDYTNPGANAVVSTVTSAIHPGAIVSLHFGHRDTIDALPLILRDLDAKGLRPVTIGELLA